MLPDREKFWAFLALLGAICFIAFPTITWDVGDEKLTLADKVIVGLIGVLGTVAGALFQAGRDKVEAARIERDTKQTETLHEALRAVPVAVNGDPLKVQVDQPDTDPIPVEPAGTGTADRPVWER